MSYTNVLMFLTILWQMNVIHKLFFYLFCYSLNTKDLGSEILLLKFRDSFIVVFLIVIKNGNEIR